MTDLTLSPEKPVYSVGEVVDCAAAGNPEPSLEWTTGSNGSHTGFGRSLHIIEEMVVSEKEFHINLILFFLFFFK